MGSQTGQRHVQTDPTGSLPACLPAIPEAEIGLWLHPNLQSPALSKDVTLFLIRSLSRRVNTCFTLPRTAPVVVTYLLIIPMITQKCPSLMSLHRGEIESSSCWWFRPSPWPVGAAPSCGICRALLRFPAPSLWSLLRKSRGLRDSVQGCKMEGSPSKLRNQSSV